MAARPYSSSPTQVRSSWPRDIDDGPRSKTNGSGSSARDASPPCGKFSRKSSRQPGTPTRSSETLEDADSELVRAPVEIVDVHLEEIGCVSEAHARPRICPGHGTTHAAVPEGVLVRAHEGHF